MSKSQGENTMPMMILDAAQKKRLQQQMQQHVQLLTQIHLLASTNPSLSSEASTTKMFLRELGTFAQSSIVLHQQFNSKFQTTFQPCNLKGAIQLIEDFHSHVNIDLSPPQKVQKNDEGQNPEYPTNEFPCLPKQVAWILATSKVFMYPELLPIRSLKVKHPKDKIFFTKAEDNLLALGLKHFEGTEFPKPLISKYLLTAKSDHQLTVRIKNLNISRAPDNIIKYYKKTKQLPILFKCCEELQPDQWKPPVEREERHLPFWLKASLPAIQEEIQQLDNDAGESRDLSGLAETKCDPDLESGNKSRYPLLLPKGVVLTLKPLAKRFSSRKIWRQKSSVLKPLLIRPAPSLQPCSNDSARGRLAQCEVPPRRGEAPDPQLSQRATVLRAGPKALPLEIIGHDGRKIPVPLSSLPPKNTVKSQDFLHPLPKAFQSKVLLPSVAAPSRGEPRMKPPKRKWAEASRLLKPAPVLPSPRVILTVPATAMEVVGLNSRFNVIQPLRATAQNPQTIPITTLLVSPTSFICPLNQPLITSSIPPLLVSGNPVNLPVPLTPAENTQAKSGIPGPQPEGESAFPAVEPKQVPQDSSPPCSSPYPKEHSPGSPPPSRDRLGHLFQSNAHSWTVVKMLDGRQVLEPLSHASQMAISCLPENLLKIVKVEPEKLEEETSGTWNKFPVPNICDEIKKQSEVEPPYEEADSAPQKKQEAELQEEEGETAVGTPGEGKPGGKMSKGSPKDTSSSINPDTILSSPLGKPEDSSSVVGLTVRTHAGPETGGEKLKPKEEEEDFDQDEEMTSDSEDDVPFVPELQETVEKPTSLVSGRCMGQESDPKEEKPWKKNSCPEVVAKLEKDEADRDPSFHLCFT